MRKSFLSVYLLGALTLAATSTFVSCKDYDDDITSLQDQLSSLSDAVEKKLATAESAINTLKAAQAEMEAKLADKANAADVAALTAAINDLKAAQQTLQTALNNAATKADVAAVSAEVDAALIAAKAYTDAAIALKANQGDLDKVGADLAKVQTELQTVQTQFGTLTDEMNKALADVATMKAAVDGQKAALESQNEALKAAIAAGDAAAQKAAEEAVAALKASVDAEIAKLNAAISEAAAKAEVSALNGSVDELKAKIAGKADNEAVNTIATKVEAMNTEVSEAVSKVNAVSSEIETMTSVLSKDLRSLVFIPELYTDGIETIVYPFLQDTTIHEVGAGTLTRTRKDANGNDVAQKISYNGDYQKTTASKQIVFGPAMGVDYHMNPSVADPSYEDVKGYNVIEANVVTRANSANLGVTSPEKYSDGTQLFAKKNGIVTAGLQIAHPELLWANGPKAKGDGETGKVSSGKENLVALQINSKAAESKGQPITSDYAMLYPEKVYVEGMIWTKNLTNKKTASSDEKVYHETSYTAAGVDNICGKVHVWDTPEEALLDNQNNLVELYYDSKDGIKLEDYLGVHVYQESVIGNAKKATSYAFTSSNFARLGLTYEFSLIDYTIDKNTTHDSKYATLDSKTGQIVAKNVLADGKTEDAQAKTAVDREPLVRVLVKQGNNVILDGFILVHITEKPVTPDPIAHNDKTIDFKNGSINFDLCNGGMALSSNWSEFSYIILNQGLDLEKAVFDSEYDSELALEAVGGTNANDWYEVNHYAADKDNSAKTKYGKMYYRYDKLGTTNHDFKFELTAEELEELTHNGAKLPVTLTTYVKYAKVAGSAAEFDHVYLKFNITITRSDIATAKWGTKNHNYWYDRATGARNENENAIVLNVTEPTNWGNIATWNRSIPSTLVGNKLTVTGGTAPKYYFTPLTFDIKVENGTTYTVTAQSSASDTKYNQFVCKYLVDGTTKHTWAVKNGASDIEANDNILNTCAIDYAEGVFNNDKLYAKNGSTYTQIATLDQTTGQIELIKNDVTKQLVNAFGFEEEHANIVKELRTEIGIVAKNSCGLAVKVADPVFLAAWERPINVNWEKPYDFVDAKSNGNVLYLADIIKLYDWRGYEIDENDPVEGWRGNMERPSTKWLWAYYGVKSIAVNCNPSAVTTNMHQTDATKFVKMNTVTTQAKLYAGVNEELWKQYDFDLSSFNADSKSYELWEIFENIDGVHDAEKAQFGLILYSNNGDNVKEFDVRVPVTITYEWGSFTSYVQIHIRKSIGN